MGCCNEPVSTLSGTAPDPTQHVNYARGMVLGVDDFTQEFAYLSGRDQWLARDAIGYGTVSGLRVYGENEGTDGPRLHVGAGSALVPSGKHVCVPADQCAVINLWLAKPENAALVNRLLNPVSPPLSPPLSPPSPPLSPPAVTSGVISLYLTLCYADCRTRPVPIPGEPCRSEDELMAPSRIADDFRLELREFAPVQTEEDAVRDFVRWLRANVDIVDGSPPPATGEVEWVAGLVEGGGTWLTALEAAPPLSPPASFTTLGDYMFDLAAPMQVGRDSVCDFLRVAVRFWVTRLRPLWMAMRCHSARHADLDCVLLARVGFEVQWVGGSPTGAWQITGSTPEIEVDESTRPVLAHLRLLQEWMLCGCDCAADAVAAEAIAPPPPPPPAPPVPMSLPLISITNDLVLDENQYYVLVRDTNNLTVTLPPSVPAIEGRLYVVKNVNVTNVNVQVDGSTTDQLDEGSGIGIARGRAATLISDGAGNWYEVGGDGSGSRRVRRPS
jgi:hypothetical protein